MTSTIKEFRDRKLSNESYLERFKSAILLSCPNTTLDFIEKIKFQVTFPGAKPETLTVYVFDASNPEYIFSQYYCWVRRVVEYGHNRIITYSVPGKPDNDLGICKSPEEAVRLFEKEGRNYSIVKPN